MSDNSRNQLDFLIKGTRLPELGRPHGSDACVLPIDLQTFKTDDDAGRVFPGSSLQDLGACAGPSTIPTLHEVVEASTVLMERRRQSLFSEDRNEATP